MKVVRFFSCFIFLSSFSTLFIVVQSIKQHVCSWEAHLKMCNCTLKPRGSFGCIVASLIFISLMELQRSLCYHLEIKLPKPLMNSINFSLTIKQQRKKKVIKLYVLLASLFFFHSSTFPFCINLEQPKCFLFPQVFLSCLLLCKK